MISFLNSWASGVVASVIIGSIMEMILPEGNNKKYVKIVIGVFILFTIVSPVIARFSNGVNIWSLINFDEYDDFAVTSSTDVVNDSEVLNVYKSKILNEIVQTIEYKGFNVESIDAEINTSNEHYGEISRIWLQVSEGVSNIDSNIKKVEINISKGKDNNIELPDKAKEEIKTILNMNYGVLKENIMINED